MKSIEGKLEWLKRASNEERQLAIRVFKGQLEKTIGNAPLVTISDPTSNQLHKEFAHVLDSIFNPNTLGSEVIQRAIVQRVKQRIDSRRRLKAKNVKPTSVDLTNEGHDILTTMRRLCKASKNLVVDSLLKDEWDYTSKLKKEIKETKQDLRTSRAETKKQNKEVVRLENENERLKEQLKTLEREVHASDLERRLEGDIEADEALESAPLDTNEVDEDSPNDLDHDAVEAENDSATSEIPTEGMTKTQRLARRMAKSSEVDPDIPKKESTRMNELYHSDVDNKKLNFND
ncbi:MAG: hypothetical protein VYD07_07695 [Pseudomonadota bacterium]|nr:hypothetical protein [Pseudomonadota bacterium]